MAKLKRVMRCFNCGATVQCTDKNADGYIDPEFMPRDDKDNNQIIYCKSCYNKMKSINNGMLAQDLDDEIIKILDDAVASDSKIIWVVDLFAFNGYINPRLVEKIKDLSIMVLATKFDLFPKSYSKDAAIIYLKERFNEVGIKPYDIKIITNNTKFENGVIDLLNDFRQGHDIYMIGSATSGKTSIINNAMKFYKNKTKRQIHTGFFENTGIKVLSIPFTNSATFYELPGFSLINSATSKVGSEACKLITPLKEIKIDNKKLKGGETLLIGSIAYFDIIKGNETVYKWYSAEGVQTKKVNDKKLNEVFKRNLDKKELLPNSDRLTSYKEFDLFEYDMEDDKKMHDIGISGIGWISFVAEGQVIRVLCPKGTAIKECLSKIK